MTKKIKDPYKGKEFITYGLGRIRVKVLKEGSTLSDSMTAIKMLLEAQLFTGEKLTEKEENVQRNTMER